MSQVIKEEGKNQVKSETKAKAQAIKEQVPDIVAAGALSQVFKLMVTCKSKYSSADDFIYFRGFQIWPPKNTRFLFIKAYLRI